MLLTSAASSLLSTLLLTSTLASAAGHGHNGARRRSPSLHKVRRGHPSAAEAVERSLALAAAGGFDHPALGRRQADKRCKVRPSSSEVAAAAVTTSSSSWTPEATTSSSTAAWSDPAAATSSSSSDTWSPEPTPTTSSVVVELAVQPTTSTDEWVAPTTTTTSKSKWVAPTTSTSATPVASATPDADGVIAGAVGSLLAITDATCGWSGAVAHSSNEAGPNGAQSWLNCGLDAGGWTPPFVTLDEIVYADLATVLASGSSPFGPCAPYIDKMYAIGAEMNIPPIMIASFAMQESTCNKWAVGGGGEQGLFQISQDKCGGAPGGNCRDVDFNMRTAMRYFRDTIEGNGGDLLTSLGMYNGWYKGLTQASATAARWGNCCRCQNNLDYLHQFLNGWSQGRLGSSIGTYWNLKVCG